MRFHKSEPYKSRLSAMRLYTSLSPKSKTGDSKYPTGKTTTLSQTILPPGRETEPYNTYWIRPCDTLCNTIKIQAILCDSNRRINRFDLQMIYGLLWKSNICQKHSLLQLFVLCVTIVTVSNCICIYYIQLKT